MRKKFHPLRHTPARRIRATRKTRRIRAARYKQAHSGLAPPA